MFWGTMAVSLRIEMANGIYNLTRHGLVRQRIVRDDVDREEWNGLS